MSEFPEHGYGMFGNQDSDPPIHTVYTDHQVWTLGVGLASLSIILSSVGLTIQRSVHLKEQQREVSQQLCCPRRPLFLVGTLLYISASGPDVVSYALLPQAIASAINCSRLAVIAILGHYCLDERMNRLAVFGILLCITGTTLCLNFGPGPEMHIDPNPASFFSPLVIIYIVIGVFLLVVLLVLMHWDSIGSCSCKTAQWVSLPMATALAFALEKVFNKAIGFAPHKFWEYPEWLAAYGAIGVLGLLDFYLNLQGVRRMPVQVFVPACFVVGTCLCYFQSTCIFKELHNLTVTDFAVSLTGMFLSLVGAACIQPPNLRLCMGGQTTSTSLLSEEVSPGGHAQEEGESAARAEDGASERNKASDAEGSSLHGISSVEPAGNR